MPHITQRQIDKILNSRLPSPAALLKSAICARCGQLKALDKYCTYCAKRRSNKIKQRREEERLGVARRIDVDYSYERLFEERKLTPAQLNKLKYKTLVSLLWEMERVLDLTDERVTIAIHNQPRAAHLLKVLKKLKSGWAKKAGAKRKYRHASEIAELVGGEFGLTIL
jgi:hypothetical protein